MDDNRASKTRAKEDKAFVLGRGEPTSEGRRSFALTRPGVKRALARFARVGTAR
jgi:hypothetical protein